MTRAVISSLMIVVVSLIVPSVQAQTKVEMLTSMGAIEITLYDDRAPNTVANFLDYANEGYYDGTIFHRVISGFMIQGGGFEPGLSKKATKAPIKNEAQPFIPNRRGTIAMARTNDPHSATSQFFINLENNTFLNKTTSNPGYAVFGEVSRGMEIVEAIGKTATGRRGPYGDVPKEDILIKSVTVSTASE